MDGINYEAVKLWWNIFTGVALAIIGVWNWFQARSRATASDMRALREWAQDELNETKEAQHELAVRMKRAETELEHVPDRKEISELVEKMAETQSELSRAVGELAALNRQMRLVQEHLLNSKKQ